MKHRKKNNGTWWKIDKKTWKMMKNRGNKNKETWWKIEKYKMEKRKKTMTNDEK